MAKKLVLYRDTPQYKGAKAAGVVLLGLGVLYILSLSGYRIFQFERVLYLAIAVMGLNLLTGYNGQISLGHSAFFTVGAYSAAIMVGDHGLNYWLAFPVAAVLTYVLGYLFGIPALRLHGLYLALVTLALAVVVPTLVKRYESFTGGTQGIAVPQPTPPKWSHMSQDQWILVIALVVTLVMLLLARNLMRGRAGRSMVAIRDNDIAAETMGINLAAVKTRAFAWSAMYAGIAGVLYAYIVGYVAADSITVVLGITFLSAMVVGGVASISGAMWGGIFSVYVPTYAEDVHQALSPLVYGAALIIFMFLSPGGIAGLIRRIRTRFVEVRSRPGAEPGPDHGPVDVAQDVLTTLSEGADPLTQEGQAHPGAVPG